jgi:hypothetical protein
MKAFTLEKHFAEKKVSKYGCMTVGTVAAVNNC